jgi:hypothetical protein
LFVAED